MSQRRRLTLLLSLNIIMIAGLVIVGLAAGSLGVLAAGGDYAADSAAILLGIIAVTIRDRSGGRSRATTIAAAINATTLLIVTALVIIAAARRLAAGAPPVHGLAVLIVAATATLVMITGALILGKDSASEDLHMRSVLLDTISDALTSAAVAATGAIIYTTGGAYWLDPVVAIIIGLLIGYGALRLLRDVVKSLRTHSPLDIDDHQTAHPPARRSLTRHSATAAPRRRSTIAQAVVPAATARATALGITSARSDEAMP